MRFVLELKDKNNNIIYSHPANLFKVLFASRFAKRQKVYYKIKRYKPSKMKPYSDGLRNVYQDLGLDYDSLHQEKGN